MKMFIISDHADALIGFRLAGIKGVVAHDKEAAKKELIKVCDDSEIGIILITESLAEELNKEVNDIKMNPKMPVVTVIPDKSGFKRGKDYITRNIKESIGLKI